jgi:hypothetical protein
MPQHGLDHPLGLSSRSNVVGLEGFGVKEGIRD